MKDLQLERQVCLLHLVVSRLLPIRMRGRVVVGVRTVIVWLCENHWAIGRSLC